jgi:hypothetical protein
MVPTGMLPVVISADGIKILKDKLVPVSEFSFNIFCSVFVTITQHHTDIKAGVSTVPVSGICDTFAVPVVYFNCLHGTGI